MLSIRSIPAHLNRFVGFVIGGCWLLVLYIFIVWVVVGHLGSIQLRDGLEKEGRDLSFDAVERVKKDYDNSVNVLWARLEHETQAAWQVVAELEKTRDDLQKEMSKSAHTIELIKKDKSAIDDFDVTFGKIEKHCSNAPEAAAVRRGEGDQFDQSQMTEESQELEVLCKKIDEYRALEKDLTSAYSAFDSTWNPSKEAGIREQIAELRENTPYRDLFVTVKFMGGLGYGWFLSEPHELLVLQLTMVMGMLGSLVAMTWSFIRWDSGVSVRRFVFLPFVGSISAFIIFVFLKAGQLTIGSGDGSESLDPFFLSFVGIISGLLSESAYARMAAVGRNFFSAEDQELRWGVRLSAAVETAGVGTADLASYLGVEEDTVESLVKEKSAATLQQQQLIAACLRRRVRDLFTDVPPGGRKAEQGEVVEPVEVPDLIGKEKGALEPKLAAVGLRLGDAHKEEPSDKVPAGKVVAQTPAAGEKVARDTPVNVTVSVGPPDE